MATQELYKYCRKLSEDIQSSVATKGVVKFNHELCKHLAKQYSSSFEQLKEQLNGAEYGSDSCVWVSSCEPALKELKRLMLDGRRLVEACKKNDWWKRAIVYADHAAFEERIYCHLLHFLGCFDSLKAAYAEATNSDLFFSGKPSVEDETEFREEIIQIGKEDTEFLIRYLTEAVMKNPDPLATFLHDKLTVWSMGTRPARMNVDAVEFPDSSVKDLGRGTSGRVQECLWHGEAVAVKSLFNSGDRITLVKEAQVLEGLSHPNVVHIVGCGLRQETDMLVMEPMDKDLSRWIKELSDTPLNWLVLIDVILQIAEGLQYLHSLKPHCPKVIHRDMKPSNISLTRACEVERAESAGHVRVKVADFGMSKTKELISHFKTAGVGTLLYTAPEILDIRSKDGARESYTWSADVWSFSITVSEILTRKEPFAGVPAQLLKRLKDGERPALPSDIPPYFSALIEKCWDMNPSERPSFVDICDMLLYCKNASLRGRMPSNIASINEYNCRKFIRHLGAEWCLHEGSLHHKLISLDTYFKVLSTGEQDECSRTLLVVGKRYGGWTSPEQDLERAMRLFHFAAKTLNHPEALWRLGLSFELGLGTEVNMANAITNYQAASDLGFAPADVELGLCYAVGRGVPADLDRAVDYWKRALRSREEAFGTKGVEGKQAVDSTRELIQHIISWSEAEGRETSAFRIDGDMRPLQRLVEITSVMSEGRRLVAGHKFCNIPDLVRAADQKPKCAALQNLLDNLSKDEEIISKSILSSRPMPQSVRWQNFKWLKFWRPSD